MRKFLRQKFWSHGTPLGSLGPLSFEALGPGASQCQILLIWGPYECLDLVALQVQAETLKPIRSWCVAVKECAKSNFVYVELCKIIIGYSILMDTLVIEASCREVLVLTLAVH